MGGNEMAGRWGLPLAHRRRTPPRKRAVQLEQHTPPLETYAYSCSYSLLDIRLTPRHGIWWIRGEEGQRRRQTGAHVHPSPAQASGTT